jgi:hypothetical protein
MQPNDTALRKRTQISKANRTMFIWIAGASALVGFALVAAIFLGQKLIFNEKVLIEKNKTVATLDANNKVIDDLQNSIEVLDTNEALIANRAQDSDRAIQVILDALPSDANSLALGASLQNRLLANIPGLTLESLQVDPVQGIEELTEDSVQDASGDGSAVTNQITFRFVVSGTQEALKQVLTNLERSIRTIDVLQLQIENQGTTQVLTIDGRAFYEPAKEIKLYDKAVRP